MKRSKRSMVTRAFKRGYSSGLAGRSQVACPHEKSPHRCGRPGARYALSRDSPAAIAAAASATSAGPR
jgi:ribosome modulation factor